MRTPDDIYEQFCGTCESLDLTDEESDSAELLAGIDQLMFNCAVCGWWYDVGEDSANTDEMTCESCGEEDAE